ncbi:MAG: hypothetical protein ABGX16_08460 [Pirellulales bacterium]
MIPSANRLSIRQGSRTRPSTRYQCRLLDVLGVVLAVYGSSPYQCGLHSRLNSLAFLESQDLALVVRLDRAQIENVDGMWTSFDSIEHYGTVVQTTAMKYRTER